MKKLNESGFVLAETLVVTVFLMLIFQMIYSNFYPLIGEYEKREVYNDVDGIYSTYWIKQMIEDSSYSISEQPEKVNNLRNKGYVRFECNDIQGNEDKQNTCKRLVKALEVDGCTSQGYLCEIYITKYQIGNEEAESTDNSWFKNEVKNETKKAYQEMCTADDATCKNNYINKCSGIIAGGNPSVDINENQRKKCILQAEKKLMKSDFKDYINFLPDYSAESLNYAKYRVIVVYHHKKDNNNYYSYATMEVNK